MLKLHLKIHPNSPTMEMNGKWRGGWLIRSHRRARRKTFFPDWRSSELSQFEVEPYKAMYYNEAK
eukprot:5952618-Prorocentrum_lima.AAC.1